jgi:predicted RNase H-like HicB family nuclease
MDVRELLGRPWTVRVHPEVDDRGRYFVAEVMEIPGVSGYGDSDVEARDDLYAALRDTLDAMVDAGEQIPAPPRWTGLVQAQLTTSLGVSRVAVVPRTSSDNVGTHHEPSAAQDASVQLGPRAVFA